MNTNDISIKCESLSLDYDAPIIAVGAVAFDHTTGKMGHTFYEEVTMASAIQHSRPSSDMMLTWLNRNPRARTIFSRPDADKKPLSTVLFEFMQWVRTTGKGVPVVWANGTQHEITWLQHALHVSSVGVYPAWHYQNVRDTATLALLAAEIKGDHLYDDIGEVVAVNAMEDAKHQVAIVHHCYKLLGGKPAIVEPTKPLKGRVIPKPTVVDDDDEL